MSSHEIIVNWCPMVVTADEHGAPTAVYPDGANILDSLTETTVIRIRERVAIDKMHQFTAKMRADTTETDELTARVKQLEEALRASRAALMCLELSQNLTDDALSRIEEADV